LRESAAALSTRLGWVQRPETQDDR
jgi:hypothetical protein